MIHLGDLLAHLEIVRVLRVDHLPRVEFEEEVLLPEHADELRNPRLGFLVLVFNEEPCRVGEKTTIRGDEAFAVLSKHLPVGKGAVVETLNVGERRDCPEI